MQGVDLGGQLRIELTLSQARQEGEKLCKKPWVPHIPPPGPDSAICDFKADAWLFLWDFFFF